MDAMLESAAQLPTVPTVAADLRSITGQGLSLHAESLPRAYLFSLSIHSSFHLLPSPLFFCVTARAHSSSWKIPHK